MSANQTNRLIKLNGLRAAAASVVNEEMYSHSFEHKKTTSTHTIDVMKIFKCDED